MPRQASRGKNSAAPKKPSPSTDLSSRLEDCAAEVRAFVRFGDYALEKLPRVARRIFDHFGIPQDYMLDVLLKARVPSEVVALVQEKCWRGKALTLQSCQRGIASRPWSTARARPGMLSSS